MYYKFTNRNIDQGRKATNGTQKKKKYKYKRKRIKITNLATSH